MKSGIPRPIAVRNCGSGHRAQPQTPLAKRLRELRHQTGMNIKEFAGHSGLQPNRITDWEIGINTPTVPTLQRYALAFGITVAELIEGVM